MPGHRLNTVGEMYQNPDIYIERIVRELYESCSVGRIKNILTSIQNSNDELLEAVLLKQSNALDDAGGNQKQCLLSYAANINPLALSVMVKFIPPEKHEKAADLLRGILNGSEHLIMAHRKLMYAYEEYLKHFAAMSTDGRCQATDELIALQRDVYGVELSLLEERRVYISCVNSINHSRSRMLTRNGLPMKTNQYPLADEAYDDFASLEARGERRRHYNVILSRADAQTTYDAFNAFFANDDKKIQAQIKHLQPTCGVRCALM